MTGVYLQACDKVFTIYMVLINEFHVLELRIEVKWMCMVHAFLALLK